MYLKTIRLENIKTYRDLTIDFEDRSDSTGIRLWSGFLGPNGMGKSILLDCIAISLAGETAIRALLPYPRKWVRSGSPFGEITSTIIGDEETEKFSELTLKYYVTGEEGAEINGKFLSGAGIFADPQNEQNQYFEKIAGPNSHGYLVCGYGPFRRLPRAGERPTGSLSEENPKASRLVTLFDEGSPVSHLEQWLIDLEYNSLKGGGKEKRTFETAIDFLHNILPNATFEEIKDKQILFKTDDGVVPLNELSDGYRSVIAWSANLVKHVFASHDNLPDPMNGSGVVVVDEIDVHLHPEAQRKIVDRLRGLFPKIQFIISSHSPFVAQSLKQNELFRLERFEEQTIVRQLEISFEGWRADQILTSDAFGLDSSRSINTEKEFKTYEKLITNIEMGKASKKDEIDAENLKKKIFSKIPFSGETQKMRELQEQVGYYRKELEKLKKNDQSQ